MLLVINSALFVGCKTVTKAEHEDDIREAVFRYQFEHWGSNKEIYYLSLSNQGDPTDEFTRRFKDIQSEVRKASLAERAGGEIKGGVIFFVREIKWINDNEVEIEGGYHRGGLDGSGHAFQVMREKGKWVVKKDTTIWMS